MSSKAIACVLACVAVASTAIGGTSRYVVPPGTPDVTPGSGFTTWATAGTNIQNVVDGSVATDVITVSNGTYTVLATNLVVAKAVRIQSFGGEVIVDGNYPTASNRCLFMDDAGAVISEITFKNGYAKANDRGGFAGGVYLNAGVLSNCTVTLNTAANQGGGVYIYGFSAPAVMRGGLVSTNTSLGADGGGIHVEYGSVYDVLVTSNTCNGGGGGGGLYVQRASAVISNCTAVQNRSMTGTDGGGIMLRGGTVVDCLVSNNYSSAASGGLYLDGAAVTGLNCRVLNNVANKLAGGLYMQKGSVASGMTIVGNVVTNPTTAGTVGAGGVYMNGVTALTKLLSSRISGNQCSYVGGGLRCEGSNLISNCTIDGNMSTNSSGGGVYASAGLLVSGCVISNNSCPKPVASAQGGGLYAVGGVTVLVSTICNNTADDKGGGLRLGGDARVQDCTIGPGNSAADGGGIAFFSGGIVSNCTIVGNFGKNGDSGGGFWTVTYGEIYNSSVISNATIREGGGGFCRGGMIMRNCLVAGNRATNTNYRGGGLYVDHIGDHAGRIENCTITTNMSYYRGGGICLNSGNNTNAVVNCIVYGNATVTGVAAEKDMYAATVADTNAPLFSCFTGLTPPPDKGNISSDPRFMDVAAADYRLKPASPCRDTGTNLAWMVAGATDRDGRPRVVPTDGRVDMGAYEAPIQPGSIITIR